MQGVPTDRAGDPFYQLPEESARANAATVEIVKWAGRLASEKRGSSAACEDTGFAHKSPMMFPEEFDLIVKTLAQLQPVSYLEWGSGMSTSFYPLLASGDVRVIDGYPPWCKKVGWESGMELQGYIFLREQL